MCSRRFTWLRVRCSMEISAPLVSVWAPATDLLRARERSRDEPRWVTWAAPQPQPLLGRRIFKGRVLERRSRWAAHHLADMPSTARVSSGRACLRSTSAAQTRVSQLARRHALKWRRPGKARSHNSRWRRAPELAVGRAQKPI